LEEEKPTLSSKDSQIIRLTERELYFSIIEKTFSVSKETLVSNSRSKEVSEIRKIAIYAAHKQLKIPVVELSKWFQKTHSTIHYAIKKTEDYYLKQHPFTVKSIEAINVELSRMRTSAQA
jgi:chromosomal replication initiation ATPase DnaA